jgi:hypothetical protein
VRFDDFPATYDRPVTLELLEGHAYAGLAQRLKRCIETPIPDHLPEVADATPGQFKQPSVGTAGIVEDALFRACDEVGFPFLDPAPHNRSSLLKTDALLEKVRQTFDKGRKDPQLVPLTQPLSTPLHSDSDLLS